MLVQGSVAYQVVCKHSVLLAYPVQAVLGLPVDGRAPVQLCKDHISGASKVYSHITSAESRDHHLGLSTLELVYAVLARAVGLAAYYGYRREFLQVLVQNAVDGLNDFFDVEIISFLNEL